MGKLLEKVIHRRLTAELDAGQFFETNQFDFLKSRSTEIAINKLLKIVKDGCINGMATLVISIDIVSAFDILKL